MMFNISSCGLSCVGKKHATETKPYFSSAASRKTKFSTVTTTLTYCADNYLSVVTYTESLQQYILQNILFFVVVTPTQTYSLNLVVNDT